MPLRTNRKKVIIIIAAAILLIAALITILELTNKTTFFHEYNPTYETQKNTPNRTAGQNTKGEQTADSDKEPSPTPRPADDKAASDGNTASDPLVTPSGNFVSNHRPNLDGDPAPNEIQSVCVTTPGATCTIVFTKGGTSKSLPSQKTDQGGAAYWTWKLQDIGLTTGEWKVEAKATLNGKTMSAQDSINLEVRE